VPPAFGEQQPQVQVRVEFSDVPAKGTATHEAPSSEFEASDRGVQIGALFVPWARVVEYDWTVRQEVFEGLRENGAAALRVRVVVDDDTSDGRVYEVPGDRFEAGPWTVMLLIDRHVDAEAGALVIQKLFVPWHRVVSVERYTARPDLGRETPAAVAAGEAPSRPDVVD
jgi:alkylated DNA nucleotide flippase Atl1